MPRELSKNHYRNKALLLSALVFPGLGLWWLKQYKRAIIFILPAGFSLGTMLTIFGKVYSQSVAQIQQEGDAILFYDPARLVSHIYSVIMKYAETYSHTLNTFEMIFIAAWLCGIVSSFFVGQQKDLAEQQKKDNTEESV